MGCVNYKNQGAIDAIIREANQRLMKIDKASGIDPRPMYTEGTMPCNGCADAGNPDILAAWFDESSGGKVDFHRLCYREG